MLTAFCLHHRMNAPGAKHCADLQIRIVFTTAMYQADVAGKPRLSGARAALEALGVPDAERQAVPYAERKQKRLEELIAEGSVTAFPTRFASFRRWRPWVGRWRSRHPPRTPTE